MRKLFLVRALLLAGFALAACLQTGCAKELHPERNGLVLSQEWRFDPAGSATLQEIRVATDWQPLGRWESLGLGPEVVWVRVRLRAADPGALGPWVLSARPVLLDRLTLYDPATGLGRTEGYEVPPRGDSIPSVGLSFQIPALERERDVYLRRATNTINYSGALPLAQGVHFEVGEG